MSLDHETPDGETLTIVVTGVNRGIGKSLAAAFAARGHRVIGTVRDPARAAAPAPGVELVGLDLTDDDSIRSAAAGLPGAIDVLVNNAGVLDTLDASRDSTPLGTLTRELLHGVVDVNAVGTLLLTQALLPHLRAGRARRIVFISSSLGSIEQNTTGGRHAYRMSKAAVNMVARTVARDLAEAHFTVVAMDPGWVRTDMGGPDAPLGVDESAADLAATIAALTPDRSGAFLDRTGAAVPW